MSDFKAKMHKIRFPLGLHHRPRWGSSQRSPTAPRPLKCIQGGLLLRGGRRKREEEAVDAAALGPFKK